MSDQADTAQKRKILSSVSEILLIRHQIFVICPIYCSQTKNWTFAEKSSIIIVNVRRYSKMDWLFRNECFYPDDYQKTVYDVNYPDLKKKGIKLILIDLDNTLIPYDESEPNEKIYILFRQIETLGFKTVIISNNHFPRVKHFSDLLNTPFVASAKKPLKSGFKKALLTYPEINKEQVCVIGDQFMTDVLGAKRSGLMVIVVDAIKRKAEKWFTRINRRLEKRVLSRMKKYHNSYYQQLHLNEKR